MVYFLKMWLSGFAFARLYLQRLCAGVRSTVPQTVLCFLPVCLPWARSLGQGLGTCDLPKATPLCHPNEQGFGKLNTPRANEWMVTVQILCSWWPWGLNLLETCKAEKREGGRRLLSVEERQLEINYCGEQDWVEKNGTETLLCPFPSIWTWMSAPCEVCSASPPCHPTEPTFPSRQASPVPARGLGTSNPSPPWPYVLGHGRREC